MSWVQMKMLKPASTTSRIHRTGMRWRDFIRNRSYFFSKVTRTLISPVSEIRAAIISGVSIP